jgi:hypothetical protein
LNGGASKRAKHSTRHSREGGNPYPADWVGNFFRLPLAEVYPERLPCRQSKGGNNEEEAETISLCVNACLNPAIPHSLNLEQLPDHFLVTHP